MDIEAIRARYAHYSKPAGRTAVADIRSLIAEVERLEQERDNALLEVERLSTELANLRTPYVPIPPQEHGAC